MPVLNEILVRIIIFVLGICGFFVAKHIRDHKVKATPLVCMVGFDCHAVVHSDYSKFLGMPVEVFGMMYYAFISIVYLLFIFAPNVLQLSSINFLPEILSLISLGAFLFSVYLIAIQIFVLKKGCSWCIVSALISTIIFLLVFLH